ncbi:PAS domain-containing protein [Natrinema sp. SYSU A 869]|uniref:PAS domain-containing protein n=1 Tax=Natrinema sp. SYSU A 869 TaxID=2871694 RepID=UPI00210260A7|nr:PAS domain-containing protein [Natrinema sp. SYSU A 869]
MRVGEPVYDRLVQHETPDAQQRWVSLTAAPLFDEDDELERIIVAGKDITELKEKERQFERQRDELRHELDEVYERVTDAFFAADTDLRFTHLNDRAEELLGTTEGNVYGEYMRDSFPEFTERSFKEQYERAMMTQEPVSFEEYSDTADAWFEVRAYPSDTGLSIYFTDITERKGRERKLKQYEQLVETVWDGYTCSTRTIASFSSTKRSATLSGTTATNCWENMRPSSTARR